MNKLYNNENGAALVFVLLSILLLSVFGTVITSQILSAGVQVNKSQENVQAESLAVMGQTFLYEKINVLTKAEENLDNWEGRVIQRQFSPEAYYYVEITDLRETDNGRKEVAFKSTGVSSETEEIIAGEIILESEPNGSWIEDIFGHKEIAEDQRMSGQFKSAICEHKNCELPDQGNVYFPYGIELDKGRVKSLTFEGKLWIDGNIAIEGSRSITANGFVIVEGSRLSMNGSSLFKINGDAYFDLSGADFSGRSKGYVIVEGNAYFENPEYSGLSGFFCIKGETNLKNYEPLACQ